MPTRVMPMNAGLRLLGGFRLSDMWFLGNSQYSRGTIRRGRTAEGGCAHVS